MKIIDLIHLIKVREKDFTKTYFLLGLIPIFKCKDFDSHYIFRILGIRFSIRHKTKVNCKPVTSSGVNTEKRCAQLIVSLTSHPPRIKASAVAINTLLQQSLKPDKLILWLADSQFLNKEKDLPQELLNLTKFGLEIRWCKDLGSYKKIIPSLKEFPKDIIVTADDDIYYQEDWLETLYNAYLEAPENIYVKRAVKMHIVNEKIVGDARTLQEKIDELPPSFSYQLMGGSGCLFPPHSLHGDIFDENNFLNLIPTHDDIYLWAMAMLNGTKIKVVSGYKAQMETVDGTSLSALSKTKNAKNGSGLRPDEAFDRLIKRYPEIIEILKSEDKISVVIPTLQKNKEIFFNLLSSLDRDNSVSEIIVIDNSCQGVEHSSRKLKVIIPETNLFVNPSWNLGVKEAKEDKIAILNDDITIPEDFCSTIAEQISPDKGIIGYDIDFVEVSEETLPPPKKTKIILKKLNSRCKHWGIALFFHKTSYCEIPKELKIYYGDDWILEKNKKNHKQNYSICGQKIYHCESLSSGQKAFNPISEEDTKQYNKLTSRWWKKIFNIEPVYKGFRLTILGLKLLHHYDKNH